GAPQVNVYAGGTGTLLLSFLAFGGAANGVNVALGNLEGNGHAQLIAGAGPGSLPLVMAYDLNRGGLGFATFVVPDPLALTPLADPAGLGGVRVGALDLNGHGIAEILATLGPGSPPLLFGFRALPPALVDAFFLFDPRFAVGTFVGGSH